MAVFVSGGAGYIGTHTCVALLQAGYDIVVADDLSNASHTAVERVRALTGCDFPFFEIDVRDADKLYRIFKDCDIDGIIHFAGKKCVPESVSRPLDYYDNNLNTTLALARAAVDFGAKSFIFSSSATVYGSPKSVPIREDADRWCTNPYGWTKYMSEQILADAAAAAPGLGVVLLRYFNPVGAHKSGMLGEDPNGIPNNLMPNISQVAVGKRECVRVFGTDYDTPDGTGVRDYIHVADLAAGHLCALEYAGKTPGTAAVNLGTGRGYSVLELIHTFERVNGVSVPYVTEGRRPGDIASCYADPGKAAALFGWEAKLTLDDMCADSWRWQKQNPNGYREDGEQ